MHETLVHLLQPRRPPPHVTHAKVPTHDQTNDHHDDKSRQAQLQY
ncbi:hypothetical protein [Embleya sp. NBC_00896]|nr:hypothetical protein OG928_45890 [Embleya sp. NBC_00896]